MNNQAKKVQKEKKVIKLDKQPDETAKPHQAYDPDRIVFALDIGTRTVIGVMGIWEKDRFRTVAVETLEHKSRSMFDGQIHDIDRVAEVAGEVKHRLEIKTGIKLTKVAIAAAGRVLKTCEARVEHEIDPGREIDREMVNSLEIECVRKCKLKFEEEASGNSDMQFYCVGYSVVDYYLNGYMIASLPGHKGRQIGVNVLATFLPSVVVDSLHTVMLKIGLEVTSMTLEPIAAINVAIPKELRLLNLALADIGAGTSDIAVTRDGSVVAYAMVPVAGDEITEGIIQHYLVDFNTGERIKKILSTNKKSISYTDILNRRYAAERSDIMEAVRPTIEYVAETVSKKILELNHKAPNAVFLIGGGSQTPGLSQMIAQQLGLDPGRVAVRGRDVIKNLDFNGKTLSGPESVTPFGIAVSAQMQKGGDFVTVTVNGDRVRMFNAKRLTVADALVVKGFEAGRLIGRSGKSITFMLNGDRKVLKGEHGKAAVILVNRESASLETVLNTGDVISIIPAEDGKSAEARISEFLSDDRECRIYANDREVDRDYRIRDADVIELIPGEEKGNEKTGEAIPVTVNGKTVLLEARKQEYIFVDIFNNIDFDLSKPGGTLTLKLNGKRAAYTDKLKYGDKIDIHWE